MPRILVADDSEAMRSLMARIFQDLLPEAELLIADSGEEAIRLASSCTGDLTMALLDYQMEGMNGIDCALRLRELHPGIDVHIITGEYLDPIAQDGKALGIDVMPKPPTKKGFEELIDRIRDQ